MDLGKQDPNSLVDKISVLSVMDTACSARTVLEVGLLDVVGLHSSSCTSLISRSGLLVLSRTKTEPLWVSVKVRWCIAFIPFRDFCHKG